MSGKVEIKKLGKNEIARAKSLIVMFGSDWEDDENFPPADEYIGEMLSRDDFQVLVALDGERLVGGATAYEMKMFKRALTEMFLYEIEVLESYRRRGIGTALIEALKQICREKGIAEMFVATAKDNTAARKLYVAGGGKADENSVWFNYLID